MMISDVTVIIPNYNGLKFMETCMNALNAQSYRHFDVLVVDNGSTDGSVEWLKEKKIPTLFLKENLGFAGGVNAGLKEVNTEYVILLNNDTEVFPDYIEELVKAIKKSKKIFSVSPMMIQSMNRDLMDDAGDGMCILGWGYQIGVGEKISGYTRAKDVFTACAGAAIYRKAVLDEIGYFDEMHFAYLEDIDLGYRAKLAGYFNRYEPRAKVYHFGSGTSGSKYNGFKVRLAARNNIYLHYKNQANWQLLFNSFFLFAGIAIKAGFFYKKGFLKEYLEGLFEGIKNCKKCKRVDQSQVPLTKVLAIEGEMILGMVDYSLHFLKRRMQRDR
jgi:hypothetical protein